MGNLAEENVRRLIQGRPLVTPPPTTAHGALIVHLTDQRLEISNRPTSISVFCRHHPASGKRIAHFFMSTEP
jgi:folate-dependent tRNA-U54 methylase TrmFO/GidA